MIISSLRENLSSQRFRKCFETYGLRVLIKFLFKNFVKKI